jgi:hypothetical protein
MTQMLRRCSLRVAEKDEPSSVASIAVASADGQSGRFEKTDLESDCGVPVDRRPAQGHQRKFGRPYRPKSLDEQWILRSEKEGTRCQRSKVTSGC